MDKLLFDRIVNHLLPEMDDPASRKALIESALFGSPLLAQIQWDGAAHPFTIRLVKQLHQYGEIEVGRPALVILLEEVKTGVGENRQRPLDILIQALLPSLQTPMKGHKMSVESGLLVGFLLEVGRWAKSELSERWKLHREQQTADMTSKAEVEAQVPAQLEALPPREVERITALIERKRDAIDRARHAKLADREEYDAQKLTKAAFEQREKEHNRMIRQMLDEIANDLNDLGFEVERGTA